MIGRSDSRRKVRQTSTPSTSGKPRSRSTRSDSSAALIAAPPVVTCATSKPSRSSPSTRGSAIAASSSTSSNRTAAAACSGSTMITSLSVAKRGRGRDMGQNRFGRQLSVARQPRRRGPGGRSCRGIPSASSCSAASMVTRSTSVSGREPLRATAHVATMSPSPSSSFATRNTPTT